MRFLADEDCDSSVVRALRAAGHDVIAVAEISPRADDTAVIALARDENRVLLTEDKDFGQLVYASGSPSAGIVLFRFPARARGLLSETALKIVQEKGNRLAGRFVVVQPGRVRIGLPPSR
jgi:predicted nuclease of predicted toxin-antitoxin system